MSTQKIYQSKKLQSIIWVVGALLLILILVAAMRSTNNAICKKIIVKIKGNEEQQFITEPMILQLIKANSIINKLSQDDINLKAIESKLLQNIWVQKAAVFFENKNDINIEITQRQPLYRLFCLDGNSFYVDVDSKILPLNDDFAASLPVFTGYKYKISGNTNDSNLLAPVSYLANYIGQDEFWKAQIQQIEIVNDKNFEIVPTVGNHTILFGDTSNMIEKFAKLKKYYSKVATAIGFDKFKYLNIQFKDQVIGTDTYVNIMDSMQVRRNIQNFLHNAQDTLLAPQVDTLRNDTIRASQTRPNSRNVRPQNAIVPATTTPRTTPNRSTQQRTPIRPPQRSSTNAPQTRVNNNRNNNNLNNRNRH